MRKSTLIILCILSAVFFTGALFDFLLTRDFLEIEQENVREAEKTENRSSYIPNFDHIVLIVMENRSYNEVVGNKNAPYANKLTEQNGFAANYYAVTHPSLPNYIALLGGDTYGIKNNCIHCFVSKTNLIDQLEHAHKTWKAYFESLPSACFLGSEYPYTRKYNSFVYFTDIVKNQKRCHKIVPLTDLAKDLKNTTTTPNFLWIAPNLCHDTHYCRVGAGDKWLAGQVPKILASPAFQKQNSLLIITWDEAERRGRNHIPTIFIGRSVKKDFKSEKFYNHYSLLHTIETSWGIPPISKLTRKSAVMSDFFIGNN